MSRAAIHAFVRIAVLSIPFALLAPAVARAAPPALDVLETQLRGGRCPVAERPGELCGERTLSARLRDWALDRERVTYECVRAAAPCLARSRRNERSGKRLPGSRACSERARYATR